MEKTILKLYANGDFETVDVEVLQLEAVNLIIPSSLSNGTVNSTGEFTSHSSVSTTAFIKVFEGKRYLLNFKPITSISYLWIGISYFDESYNFISQASFANQETAIDVNATWTCPENVAYVRIGAGEFESFSYSFSLPSLMSFSEDAIILPPIIEYPPEPRNYFVKNTSVSGWAADFEMDGKLAGEVHPPSGNNDRTSDFIDVSDWNDFTVRIVQENLDNVTTPSFRVLTYDSSKQFKRIFHEPSFNEYILENDILIATLKTTLNDDDKYIRVSLNHYDNPNVITKITVNNGITTPDKYYLAIEDLPSWVQDTGHPFSFFTEGIVIKGNLIQTTT